MDAIVRKSCVSSKDGNNKVLDENGSGDKSPQKKSESTSRRQPETTYDGMDERQSNVVNEGENVITGQHSENGVDRQPSGPSPPKVVDKKKKDLICMIAQCVIALLAPVSLCMLIVVATINSVNYYSKKDPVYTPFHESDPDIGGKILDAIGNSLIILTFIAVITILLMVLYKKRWNKIIYGCLLIYAFLLLSGSSYLYLEELLKAYNIPMDYITTLLIIWNFGVCGVISIYWKGPLQLQQAYLIFVAVFVALLIIKFLPEVTIWVYLAVMSFWDLFAVLSPKGPLRVLAETAYERKEFIFPGLVYPNAGFPQECSSTSENRPRQQQVEDQANIANNPNRPTSLFSPLAAIQARGPSLFELEFDENVFALGLGDFILFSVLVGKVSSYGDWNTTIACFVAILIGLCLTLLSHAFTGKVFPALPISVFLGYLFCFGTSTLVRPFTEHLSAQHAFI